MFTGKFMYIFQNKCSITVLPKFLGIDIDYFGQIHLNLCQLNGSPLLMKNKNI